MSAIYRLWRVDYDALENVHPVRETELGYFTDSIGADGRSAATKINEVLERENINIFSARSTGAHGGPIVVYPYYVVQKIEVK